MTKTLVLAIALSAACGNHKDRDPPAPAPTAPAVDEATRRAREMVDKAGEAVEESARAAEAARKAADTATQAAGEATETVRKLERDATDLTARVNRAIDAVVAAQTDNDRAAAKAQLDSLRREKAELEGRIAAAKAAAAAAERQRGVKISKDCMDNPLARGCQ